MCFNTLNIIERLRELSATPWLRDPAHSLSLHSAMITTRMNLKWTEEHWEIQDNLKRRLVHYIIHCRTCRCLHSFCMFLLTLPKSSLPMRSLKNPCLVHNCAPSWCITLYRQCISFLVLRKSWTISSTPKGSKQPMVSLVLSTSVSRLSRNRSFAVTNRTNYRVSGFLSWVLAVEYVTMWPIICSPVDPWCGNMWKHVETCCLNCFSDIFFYARWGLPNCPMCSPLPIPNISNRPTPVVASINSKKREEALVDGVAHEDICNSWWSKWSQNGKEHCSLTRTAAAVQLSPIYIYIWDI